MTRRFLTISFLLVAIAFVLGCQKDAETKPAPAAAAEKTAATEKPAVKPGSHEDWCDEHGVPESQCTLCDPSLAAAFKATGDWCDEHGLPESQCRKCNPDLKIVRPPKSEVN
jgi:hypothetical protein